MSEEEAEAWGVTGTMPHAHGVLEAPHRCPHGPGQHWPSVVPPRSRWTRVLFTL